MRFLIRHDPTTSSSAATPPDAEHRCRPGDPERTPTGTQVWCGCGQDRELRDDGPVRGWVPVPGPDATRVAGQISVDAAGEPGWQAFLRAMAAAAMSRRAMRLRSAVLTAAAGGPCENTKQVETDIPRDRLHSTATAPHPILVDECAAVLAGDAPPSGDDTWYSAPLTIAALLARMTSTAATQDRAAEMTMGSDPDVASLHVARAGTIRYWTGLLRACTERAPLAGHSVDAPALELAVDRLQRLAQEDDTPAEVRTAIQQVITAAVRATGATRS